MDCGRLESVSGAEVAKLVDATVSKTVALNGACRFESGLRHQGHVVCWVVALPSGVKVAQRPLKPLV